MSHYYNKYKKEYMSNVAKQKILNQSSSALNKHQLYVNKCYSNSPMSSSLGPRSYQAPQAGDGYVYTRENGIVTDRQPIYGYNQYNISTQEESDDENDSTFDYHQNDTSDLSSELIYCKNKYEEEIEQLKRTHEEQIKEYKNKLDKEKISSDIKIAKETYEKKLKKQQSIQKELKELENILQLDPTEFKIFELIESDDLELYLDILTTQTDIINEENDRLLLIIESHLG
jgi:hypothetical protein